MSNRPGHGRKRSREEIAAQVHAEQRITIEVGERSFRCKRGTWTLIESSVLAVAVSLLQPSAEDATLDAFFDEDPDTFSRVVAYLRSGGRRVGVPDGDADLDAYKGLAEKLSLARLAAHLGLEAVRRDVEREATYLDGQINRARRACDDWRRRTGDAVHVDHVILDLDAAGLSLIDRDDNDTGYMEELNENILNHLSEQDSLSLRRRFKIAGVMPLAVSENAEGLPATSTKVCVLLERSLALHEQDNVPENHTFVTRLLETLLFRRLGLQRLLSRLPGDVRRRSTLVSATMSTRTLYRDLYSFQGYEANEADQTDNVEFEEPLYCLTGHPQGGTFEQLDPENGLDGPGHHTWATELPDDDEDHDASRGTDGPWFDASRAEVERHGDITRLLAELHGP